MHGGELRFMLWVYPWVIWISRLLEMLNILAALKFGRVSGKICLLQVLNSDPTEDLTLAAIARNIQLQAATRNINHKVTHIPGKRNIIADLLFRCKLL